MNDKKVFKRTLIGLQQKEVEDYIHELRMCLAAKDNRIDEMERKIHNLAIEKYDLTKQLNALKAYFDEQMSG